MLRVGDTFLLPRHTDHTEHLWIAITEPEPETGVAVCVNITSRQSFSETTVILNVGDHPFISHESVVYYSDACSLNLRELEVALSGRHSFICEQQESCSPALLKRIQEGLLVSRSVKRRIKEYCQVAWK